MMCLAAFFFCHSSVIYACATARDRGEDVEEDQPQEQSVSDASD